MSIDSVLIKNIYINFFFLFLLTVCFPLLAISSAHLSSENCNFNTTKKTSTAQNFNIQPKANSRFFIGLSGKSSNVSDELICEERNDDETKQNYITRSSYSSDLLINLTKPTVDLSSREFAYYTFNSGYNSHVNLYTLFCSWKSFLN